MFVKTAALIDRVWFGGTEGSPAMFVMPDQKYLSSLSSQARTPEGAN